MQQAHATMYGMWATQLYGDSTEHSGEKTKTDRRTPIFFYQNLPAVAKGYDSIYRVYVVSRVILFFLKIWVEVLALCMEWFHKPFHAGGTDVFVLGV
jgi:hypothetical protein